ncbi:hypothetical protein [Halalkalicoccus tibetensis]|uniref:Major facilitator superfamily (MFS) profile domain-containing protein n=1 Tax=Halalkalicoccus tibetensis TaxID=175632 RepID=A0ABD5V4Q5_9EURY
MRAVSVSVAALLLATAVLALGAVATFASTLSTDPRSVGTLAALTLAVVAAVALGIRTAKRSRTSYW